MTPHDTQEVSRPVGVSHWEGKITKTTEQTRLAGAQNESAPCCAATAGRFTWREPRSNTSVEILKRHRDQRRDGLVMGVGGRGHDNIGAVGEKGQIMLAEQDG